MNKPTHTPGPWSLFEVGGDNGTVAKLCPVSAERQSILTITEEDGSVFAAVFSDADARLIAAAPDLYESLEEVVKDALNFVERTGQSIFWLDKAEAALAKAKGEV